jgi:NADP-dependent 3-hydroxy acid dehydrogenase YdfG
MALKNKIALVTGASKGIGRALALMLAKRGVHLGLVARSEAELLSLKKEVYALGTSALIFVGDVGDENLAQRAISGMLETYGRLDIVVDFQESH